MNTKKASHNDFCIKYSFQFVNYEFKDKEEETFYMRFVNFDNGVPKRMKFLK